MTTDNRTNEQIAIEALAGTGPVSDLQIERAITALEAAGRLRGGISEGRVMKPRVLKSLCYGWLVDLYNYGDIPSNFPTWRAAFDWAYAHATQHRKEER